MRPTTTGCGASWTSSWKTAARGTSRDAPPRKERTMSETQASKESCCAPTCCGGAEAGHDPSPESLVLQVRERYSRIAEGTESGCCGGGQGEIAQAIGYTEKDLSGVPD